MFRHVSCEHADCLWFGEYLPPRVVRRGPFIVKQSRPVRFVGAVAKNVLCASTRERRLRNATRLWNYADRVENSCEEYFDILALMAPDCFADPADANSIRFTY